MSAPYPCGALRRERKKRKLSQQQLASAMRTARSYVSKLERDMADPSLSTLERAAAAFNINIAELFSGL